MRELAVWLVCLGLAGVAGAEEPELPLHERPMSEILDETRCVALDAHPGVACNITTMPAENTGETVVPMLVQFENMNLARQHFIEHKDAEIAFCESPLAKVQPRLLYVSTLIFRAGKPTYYTVTHCTIMQTETTLPFPAGR